jgi:hypothetical protein
VNRCGGIVAKRPGQERRRQVGQHAHHQKQDPGAHESSHEVLHQKSTAMIDGSRRFCDAVTAGAPVQRGESRWFPSTVQFEAMRAARCWQVLLLVYLVFDFAHPWAPGVFFFEGDQLFVDGAVTLGKGTPPRPEPAPQPQPSVRIEDPTEAVRQTSLARSAALRRFTARTKPSYSVSSGDLSSPPPSSPDSH